MRCGRTVHWGKILGMRSRGRREMPLVHRGLLLRSWSGGHPTIAAAVANAIDSGTVIDDRRVVDVVNVRDVYIRNGAIVEEASVIPASTFETISEITEAVVD